MRLTSLNFLTVFSNKCSLLYIIRIFESKPKHIITAKMEKLPADVAICTLSPYLKDKNIH